jgi:hypothetical protein
MPNYKDMLASSKIRTHENLISSACFFCFEIEQTLALCKFLVGMANAL